MLDLAQNKGKETRKLSPTKETDLTSWIQDLMELERTEWSCLHMQSTFSRMFRRQCKSSILRCWSGINWFKCFKFITGRFPSSFFSMKKRLLINSPSKWFGVSAMAPLFNMFWVSFCTRIFSVWLKLGESGMLFCWGISWNGIV